MSEKENEIVGNFELRPRNIRIERCVQWCPANVQELSTPGRKSSQDACEYGKARKKKKRRLII